MKLALGSINGKELMCKAKEVSTFTNAQSNPRGGYNARSLSNQFFLTRGGIRRQYAAAQALRRARNPNQVSTRGGNNGNERGRGFRNRGRGLRRLYGSK